MSWADTQAVVAAIQQVPAVADSTFPVLAPVQPELQPLPYVVVFPSDGVDTADRVTGPRVSEHPAFTLHVVGSSANQTQVVTGLIKARFVTGGRFIPPVVEGRRNSRGYWRSPIPLQTDTDVDPALIYQVIELGWVSEPAPVIAP